MVKNLTKVTLNRIQKIESHIPVVENNSKTWAEVSQEAAEEAKKAAEEAKEALEQMQIEIDFQDAYTNNIQYIRFNVEEVETSGVSLYLDKEFNDGAIKLEQITLKSSSQEDTLLNVEAYMHIWELINGTWTPLGTSTDSHKQVSSSFSAWNFNGIKTSGGSLYISFHETKVQHTLPQPGLQFNCIGGISENAYIIKQDGTVEKVCPIIILRYYRSYFSSYQHQIDSDIHLDPGQKEKLVTKEEIDQLEFIQKITGYNEGVQTSTSSKVDINIQDARGNTGTAQDFWKDKVNFDGTTITIFNNAVDGTAKYKDGNIVSINKNKAVCVNEPHINIQTDNLVNGTSMFENNLFLESIDIPLDNLEIGDKMFKNTIISSFDINLPNLISGEEMFQNTKLETFNKDLTTLKNGKAMFKSCAELSQFISELSSLENGEEMFQDCKLTPKSLLYIFDSIPEYKSEIHNLKITLDSNIPLQDYAEALGYNSWELVLQAFSSKGWNLTI